MPPENDQPPPEVAPEESPAPVAYGAGTGDETDGTIVEVLRAKSRREQKPDVRRMNALERDLRAVRMRRECITYEVIAKRLGYGDRSNAARAVKRRITEFRTQCAEDVAELRHIETMRLDIALGAIMRRVKDGELPAIDRLLRIGERRAALEGLDQPKTLNVEMARQLDGLLERVREEFSDDVFERFLRIVAGEPRQAPTHGDAAPEEPGGSGEVGGGAGGAAPGGEG